MKKQSRWKIYLRPFASWRFLIAFGAAWAVTNGVWYLLAFSPINIIPTWLRWFARGYIGLIYLPWSPEKLITFPIAIWIHVKLFKNDKKTKIQLDLMYIQAKADWNSFKKKFKKNPTRKKETNNDKRRFKKIRKKSNKVSDES